eukprot:TRINITY_DN124_c0_g1_i1.p2 TRINITY_DN124_c0_g1~~TRINITY_DN124_c0_g1_i1.p2  ORF type:complete len:245 (-),score=55.69 TRINITY_DN124_c0_g1_i1:907-1641(-)
MFAHMMRVAAVLVTIFLLAGLSVAEPVAEAIDVKVLTSLYQKYNAVVSKDWWWMPPDCRWYGVECNGKDARTYVSKFSFGGNWKIKGPIPYEIMFFYKIWALDFAGTSLAGPIPEQWASGMQNLNYLRLNGLTTINGTFPTFFLNGTAYPQLKELTLSDTSISGELPLAVPYETIAPLERISLRGTRITGSMPDVFCRLNIGIDVSNTDLSGCIPDCYQQLVSQNKFTFSNTKLTWCLPPSPFK